MAFNRWQPLAVLAAEHKSWLTLLVSSLRLSPSPTAEAHRTRRRNWTVTAKMDESCNCRPVCTSYDLKPQEKYRRDQKSFHVFDILNGPTTSSSPSIIPVVMGRIFRGIKKMCEYLNELSRVILSHVERCVTHDEDCMRVVGVTANQRCRWSHWAAATVWAGRLLIR